MANELDVTRQFLRHTLATIAYRIRKPITDVPDNYPSFKVGPESMSPVQIVAHLGDLMEWSLSLAQGSQRWQTSTPLEWKREVERFYTTLKNLDDYLATSDPLHAPAERLFQGPIADALTHVGQLSIMRRLAGSPVRGENYFVADVKAGVVDSNQAKAVREF